MKDFQLYGALDIGSNAARILFANVIPLENELFVFKNSLLRLPLRLGEDVYDKGKLIPGKINSLIETLKVFSSLIRIYKPEDAAVYATAAMREAANAHQVLGLLKAETGFAVNVIDGLEEARLIKDLYASKGQKTDLKVFADLGGGSLEITFLDPAGTYFSESFKIGAVRAITSGILESEKEKMFSWLDQHLKDQPHNVFFIGTGGNINTLKATFSTSKTDFLELNELKRLLAMLEPLDIVERISLHRIRPDRADVIIPAMKIFVEIMELMNVDKVHVPGGSLSDAIILELYKKRLA
jgi:exopolyphosphatase / guanosine-5'-triphosphate,3'-diphosphate pyrophosphatase